MDFRQLIGTEIEFNEAIEFMEAYPEPGMRATILGIIPDNDLTQDPEQQVWKIEFDYRKFDSHNKHLETANYYGSAAKGQSEGAEYTARETGFYSEIETIYFAAPNAAVGGDNWGIYFSIMETAKGKLAERYATEGGDMSYVEWLESLVITN